MARDHAARPAPGPDAAGARTALAGLEQDGARLAERFPTRWSVLGLHAALLALFSGADILPGGWGSVVCLAAVLGAAALLTTTHRRSGVRPAGPIGTRATWLFLGLLGTVLLAKIAVWVLVEGEVAAGWAAIPVATAFIGVLLLGAAYDGEMRVQLVRGGSRRP